MAAIRAAASERDAAGLAAGAHKLLSSLGAFGAMRACELVRQLEAQAVRRDFEAADAQIGDIEREIGLIQSALALYGQPRVTVMAPMPGLTPALLEPALLKDHHVGA
jgi:HPt (histidine-containing phosphotransfer) domain-containing protein